MHRVDDAQYRFGGTRTKNTNKVRICAFITVILAVWTIIYGLLVAFYQLGQATPNQHLIYRIEEEAQAKLS